MATEATSAIAPFITKRCPGGYRVVDDLPEPRQRVLASSKELLSFGLPTSMAHTSFAARECLPFSKELFSFSAGYRRELVPVNDETETVAPPEGLLFEEFEKLGHLVDPLYSPAATEAVLEFTNRYGLLAEPPLSVWTVICRAHETALAVRLWTAVERARRGDSAELAEHVFWRGRKCFYDGSRGILPLGPSWARLLGLEPEADQDPPAPRVAALLADLDNPRSRQFRPGNILEPARYWLESAVAANLAEGVAARLEPDGRGGFNLVFVARNLLALVWLGFARAVSGEKTFRQCAACKKWMVISPLGEGARRSRETCSNACRMRRYLNRIEQARRLRARGLAIPRIAKRVGSDVTTVQGWLEPKKEMNHARASR